MSRLTITIAAFRRPQYLLQVLESLADALKACPEYDPLRVVLGIDKDGFDNDIQAPDWPFEVIRWPERLGVNEHPRRLLQYAFTELDSDYNLHLEDDTVPSPDALRLAWWYHRHYKQPAAHRGGVFLNLYAPSYEPDLSRASELLEVPGFAAWGWAVHKADWLELLSPVWNHKRDLPIGWDHSISATMARHGLTAIAPALSRIRNIGREGGWYQTPDGYDKDFAGQVAAGPDQMQHIGDFRLI